MSYDPDKASSTAFYTVKEVARILYEYVIRIVVKRKGELATPNDLPVLAEPPVLPEPRGRE